jgi:hypothetical protein
VRRGSSAIWEYCPDYVFNNIQESVPMPADRPTLPPKKSAPRGRRTAKDAYERFREQFDLAVREVLLGRPVKRSRSRGDAPQFLADESPFICTEGKVGTDQRKDNEMPKNEYGATSITSAYFAVQRLSRMRD